MQAFYADQFVLPLPAGHRFPMSKYRLLREQLHDMTDIELCQAPEASDGELALAHTPAYLGAVIDGTLSPALQREIGFPWSEAMVARARRSVGATICAARAAILQGVAMNVAGGTHHATADRGGGYCVFNDAAVAARLMQAERHRTHRQLLRVALIDLDVHQGNGSAAIFCDDPTVFTLSLHGAKNFPFRKEVSDLDVDLPDGCGDDAYLGALDVALDELWRRHGDQPPALIFYLAGADPHEGDRLGRLKLTMRGLAERDRRVFHAARERRIPVALSMAGGYGRQVEDTVQVHLGTIRARGRQLAPMEECRMSAAPSSASTSSIPNARPAPQTRDGFRHFSRIGTRWMDNDAYGHINNVVYYSYFDTVVNQYLIEAGVLDVLSSPVIGLVVETHCNYFSPLAFPQVVEAGLRVAQIGSSSVRYQIGLFASGEPLSAAHGHFVHVYVDRVTRRPAPLPAPLLETLQGLLP